MIEPTVGRVVLVCGHGQSQAKAAMVAFVHNERLINVGGFDHRGEPFRHTSLQLLQDGDALPVMGVWAEWMPYQKGRAGRTEAAERALHNLTPIGAAAAETVGLSAAGHRPEEIARVAHEINRAYCAALGDNSQAEWAHAPNWQRISAINGVRFHLANPDAGPDASHNSWMAEKLADGWKHGHTKDPEKKTHPCIWPFESLPVEQRAKDHLFRAVVHALK